MESKPHSQRLSDADYYALVNAVTSRFDCDRVGRGIVDREGMRAEFDRVLAGLFEQLETLRRHDEAATQDAVLFRKQLVDAQEQLEAERENVRLLRRDLKFAKRNREDAQEQYQALREAAAGVVDVGTRKGMLFSTDPETRSDSLVGFYVAAHPFIALQKALVGSNPAKE